MSKSVVRIGRGLDQWEAIKGPIQNFANTIGKDVEVSHAGGNGTDPGKLKTKFYIKLFSYPKGDRHTNYDEDDGWFADHIFGLPLSGDQKHGIIYEGNKKVILDKLSSDYDDEDIVAGIFHQNTLYVPFDLSNGRSNDVTADLMRVILRHAMMFLFEGTLLEQRLSEYAKASGATFCEKYVKLCSSRHSKQLQEFKTKIDAAKKRVDMFQLQLDNEKRKLKEIASSKTSLKSKDIRGFEKSLRDEYQKIMSLPDILDVVISNDSLVVYTKEIISNKLRDGSRRMLGQFEITFLKGGVYFKNLTRVNRVNGIHHPHISPDGDACFGNIEGSIYSLLDSKEFAPLVEVVIHYLKAVNESENDSAKSWPKAVEKKTPARVVKKIVRK